MSHQGYAVSSSAERELRRQRGEAGTLQVIAVPSGHGAGDPRTAQGPQSLLRAGLVDSLQQQGWLCRITHVPIAPGGRTVRHRHLASTVERLARLTASAASEASPFLVVGGDHAIAEGTWSGVARARRAEGPLGLVWIDAHMDAHTSITSPSGNSHGMPVAHLLGHGRGAVPHLAGSRPALRPEHLCLIGVRSHERQEAALLRRLGVRVIDHHEIARIGLREAIRSALAIVRQGTAGFGMSLDLDAVDPMEAPGVGTPVTCGLSASSLSDALSGVAQLPGFAGLELVEYNPALDAQERTAAVALDLAGSVFRAAVADVCAPQNRPRTVTPA
jgi:arginase